MCGLCGVAGPGLNNWDVTNFRELLYVTALRGYQGTGVARIHSDSNKTVDIQKSVYDASYFINSDAARKHPIIRSSMTAAYMGHCRWPTKGTVTQANVHPFDTGRYVSAHNGTLVEQRFASPDKTDSEMMFREMETKGVKETLGSLAYSSAYAIQMWDKKTKKISLGRNSARTLFGVFLKNRNVFYWASESDMLRLILSRNQESRKEIKYLTSDNLYTIDPMRINSDKEYDNWEIENVGRETRWPVDDIDWASVMSETEKEISTSVHSVHPKPEVTTVPKLIYPKQSDMMPEDQVPEFLRSPKKHEANIASEFDLCFRCKEPLTENEAFTCNKCKRNAGRMLNTHDAQSTDERAA